MCLGNAHEPTCTSRSVNKDERLREAVIDRDRVCLECGGVGQEVHHVISRRFKGANDLRNLLFLCWACHQKAGAHQVKVQHIALLKRLYGYDYSDMGDRWIGLEREST